MPRGPRGEQKTARACEGLANAASSGNGQQQERRGCQRIGSSGSEGVAEAATAAARAGTSGPFGELVIPPDMLEEAEFAAATLDVGPPESKPLVWMIIFYRIYFRRSFVPNPPILGGCWKCILDES